MKDTHVFLLWLGVLIVFIAVLFPTVAEVFVQNAFALMGRFVGAILLVLLALWGLRVIIKGR